MMSSQQSMPWSSWIRQYELDTSMDFGFWSLPVEGMVGKVMGYILQLRI